MKKIICPNCNYINYFESNKVNNKEKLICSNCNSELILKKRQKMPLFFIILLIVFLVIVLCFGFINIEINYDYEYFDVPYYVTKEINKSMPVEKTICENRSYRFSTFGGNVITIGNKVFPNLQITNLEEQWGIFKINFSYINESRFPYSVYGGENLKKALDENKISVNDGDFFSENYEIMIGPHETILVDKPTEKIDKNTNYWAIGKIIEPKIEECKKKIEFINLKENKTFIETKKEKKVIKKKIYEIFFDYLRKFNLKNLVDFLIILLLLGIIILLFFKIKNKLYTQNKKLLKVFKRNLKKEK